MSNNAKVGGILSIVAGGIGLLWAAGILFMAMFFGWVMSMAGHYDGGSRYNPPPDSFVAFFALFYGGIGLVYAALSTLAIVGGIFALKRKHWGWSLAGSIAGTIVFLPCGIPAIIFISMAKPEFASLTFPPPAAPPPVPPAPPPPATPTS